MKTKLFTLLFITLTSTLSAQHFNVGDLYYNLTLENIELTEKPHVEPTKGAITIVWNAVGFEPCIEDQLVFFGSHNHFATEPAKLVQFKSINGYKDWWKAVITFDDSETNLPLKGRCMALGTNGEFNYDYSWYMKCEVIEGDAEIELEYIDESLVKVYSNSSVVYVRSYGFMSDPCSREISYSAEVTYAPKVLLDDYYDNLITAGIPDSVTYEGNTYAVTSIGNNAFMGCKSLTSIKIPRNVKKIGENIFSNCPYLTSIEIDIDNTRYDSRNNSNSIIETATNTLIAGCKGTIIPNSIINIRNRAFANCPSLTTIFIPNSICNIGEYAFYNCESLASITIPESINTIQEGTFEGCTKLNTLILPSSIENIYQNAFSECKVLYDIYCYAALPPTIDASSFTNYNAYVYVPCESQRYYQANMDWCKFQNFQCISSNNVETDRVIITPTTNDVTITWPTESNADRYTIVIKKGDDVFCTLTFNADGQLLNIAFAPSRNGNNHHAQYAEQTTNGYRFTVTGLEEGTHYTYNIDVKDAASKTIKSYSGEFITKLITAVDDITTNDEYLQKFIRNGQLHIIYDNKSYNIMGQEVE